MFLTFNKIKAFFTESGFDASSEQERMLRTLQWALNDDSGQFSMPNAEIDDTGARIRKSHFDAAKVRVTLKQPETSIKKQD